MSFASIAWTARWPEQKDALAEALAVAAAFGASIGPVDIEVVGDAAEAGAATLAQLAGDGIGEDELPDVTLTSAADAAPGRRSIELLAEQFALDGERRLRTTPPIFSTGTPEDGVAAGAALSALATGPAPKGVVLIGDGLDGIGPVAEQAAVTVVALSPLTRRVATALDFTHTVDAQPRPPHPARMPAASVVALDGRRAEDLRLAAGAPGAMVALGSAGQHGRLSLAAYGLTLLERREGLVLARAAAPVAAAPVAQLA